MPTSYCADNGVGLHYRGTEFVEAVTERSGQGAYVVRRAPDGTAVEERIAPRMPG